MCRTEVCHRERRGSDENCAPFSSAQIPSNVDESKDMALDVMMSWVEVPRMAWRLQLFGGPEVVGEGWE